MDLDHRDITLQPGTQRSEAHRHLPRHGQGERFLKGPIPFDWLAKAAQQPGHALHVGIALWYVAGMKKHATVKLSSKLLAEMGVGRHAKYSGLEALERAGLVRVIARCRGCSPTVEIAKVSGSAKDGRTKEVDRTKSGVVKP